LASIGYVPQDVFLTDDTIAANIALGVGGSDINFKRLREAAETAQIHDFILNELEDGFETIVGERGVRLSGGQRQRIGLARALYREPSILIFDEATSALDTETEAKLMDAVYKLAGEKTIIMVAHRLSTVSGCDLIFALENGRVHISDYSELVKA
jgi:ABC-type multidrug transport system fused ATPase/permease subunit